MKKLWSFCLVFFLILCVAGCGSSPEETQETESEESTTVEETETANTPANLTGVAAQIIGSWSSSGEGGEGTSTTTWTFKEDGTYTLDVETSADSGTDSSVLSSTNGTYEVNGNQLTTVAGSDTEVEDENTSASDEVDLPDVDNITNTYTITVNGNQLTMTNQDGQAEVYTKAE